MTLERRNPIPTGRYWIDVFEKDMQRFQTWLDQNKTVKVRTTQHFTTEPPRDWFLLEVLSPTPALGWDFLTVAGPEVQTSDDTVQKPPPEIEPKLDDLIQGTLFKVGAVAAGLVVLNMLINRRR